MVSLPLKWVLRRGKEEKISTQGRLTLTAEALITACLAYTCSQPTLALPWSGDMSEYQTYLSQPNFRVGSSLHAFECRWLNSIRACTLCITSEHTSFWHRI